MPQIPLIPLIAQILTKHGSDLSRRIRAGFPEIDREYTARIPVNYQKQGRKKFIADITDYADNMDGADFFVS